MSNHYSIDKKEKYWGSKGAGAILFSPEKKQFGFGRRSKNVDQPGLIGTLGGAVENGDSIKETVENELMEEIGYFYPLHLVDLFVYTDDEYQYHNFVAIIDDNNFTPKLNWENDEIVWIDYSEISKKELSGIHFGLESILNNNRAMNVMEMISNAAKKERVIDKSNNNEYIMSM
jgi:8-oxo-dGTP pyrophosphatase MutT (NUDIX family)